ncbi:MAG: tRNA (adenosine(37)-N6)-threonylcarbamoyltransferase complex ATPase subunit type 1 TsaE [Thermodesulfobacteriota bacterium]|nr:tRNA (adenosine(37)-N6)-threonylcarbamoyltransferase complex ATPase subunit type 1 TsaE [Thermodesulfobacteriota bacterium]
MNQEKQAEETWSVKTSSPDETFRLGQLLGAMLSESTVIALMGDLGTGKTVFVKGVARGLGVADERDVTSPTFVLVNEYRGRLPVFHVDLYRVEKSAEVEDLGWEELISAPGVTLVEWAEKVSKLLPEERLEVHLEWVGAVERKLVFIGKGQAARGLVQGLGEKWMKEE